MNKIKWEYGKEIPPALIEAFETEFSVRLPDSYKEVARLHDGAIPHPGGVRFPSARFPDSHDVIGLGELYSHVPGEDGISPMARINRRYQEALPGFIVFSEAGNGWNFAFERLPDGQVGSILLFTFEHMHTSGCYEVALSFDELLERLFDTSEDGVG